MNEPETIATLQKQCEEMRTKLLYAEDAAAKGDKARQNAAGLEEEIKELRTRAEKAEAEVVELKKQSELRLALIKDHCEEEETIKRIARPLLGDFKVDGDSYGVPSSQDICQSLVDKLSQLQQDVKPLINCLQIMAGGKNGEEPGAAMLSEVALETFLLKHPELSQ